ncbi:MAG: LytTR family transcriptional regulator DNA-binding domain-containing protein [Bacillota bacterium]
MNEKATILLVDDEISVLRALERVLVREGYEVHCTVESNKAIEMIDGNRYDIIICDQKMPELSGIDILEHSSNVTPDAIRILITGYSDFKVMEDAINKCRIHYYFPKPWDNNTLVDVVAKVLDEKRVRDKKDMLLSNIFEYRGHLEGLLDVLKNADSIKISNNTRTSEDIKERDSSNIISIKKDDSIIFLKPSEIYYLTSSGGKVTIVTRSDRYFSWDSLNVWGERLKDSVFFRCHRGYLVNVEKIKTITPWSKDTYNLKLKDIPDEIYSSKSYIKSLKEFIHMW